MKVKEILNAIAFILSCEFIGVVLGLIALSVMYPEMYCISNLKSHNFAGLYLMLIGLAMIAFDAYRHRRHD